MALTLKQLKMTPKRTELILKTFQVLRNTFFM